jgi:N-acetylneuraminic acid mutarotase
MNYAGGAIVVGGLKQGDRSTGSVLRLSWRGGTLRLAGRLADLAEPVHDSAGLVLHGRPTVFGGGSSVELDQVQQLSSAGRWRVVGRLPGARSDLSAAGVRGAAYLVGGYDGTQTPSAVLATRDGNRFRRVASLPGGDRYAGVARFGQDLWVLGGEMDGAELRRVLRIDPPSGRARIVGTMPVPLGHEAVVRVGPRLLVMGGRTAPDKVTGAMWWFDPRTLRWRRAGRLPYPVADAPVLVHGHHAYLFGGETPSFTAKVTRVSWR